LMCPMCRHPTPAHETVRAVSHALGVCGACADPGSPLLCSYRNGMVQRVGQVAQILPPEAHGAGAQMQGSQGETKRAETRDPRSEVPGLFQAGQTRQECPPPTLGGRGHSARAHDVAKGSHRADKRGSYPSFVRTSAHKKSRTWRQNVRAAISFNTYDVDLLIASQ
jgi:hypothetical protein